MSDWKSISEAAFKSAAEIIEKAGLKSGSVLVVGCSTSEVAGSTIGTASSLENAEAIYSGISSACREKGIYIAAQCCEHLNRAIIIEKKAVPGAYFCNAVPQPNAGGAFACVCYKNFSEPAALEHITADAGLDIGLTLIGMHIKEVAVPVRLKNNKIGMAEVIAARARPKFIGGSRTVYDSALL